MLRISLRLPDLTDSDFLYQVFYVMIWTFMSLCFDCFSLLFFAIQQSYFIRRFSLCRKFSSGIPVSNQLFGGIAPVRSSHPALTQWLTSPTRPRDPPSTASSLTVPRKAVRTVFKQQSLYNTGCATSMTQRPPLRFMLMSSSSPTSGVRRLLLSECCF